ncbi:MAG: hypothetical protein LBK62_04330 [Treponema sp.]|jgi:hypothetical protein|nr:hypothetical protein [Treponema sp.]
MGVYRPLKAGLCIYECGRLLFLLAAFMFLRPDEVTAAFPWLACVAANALFPLMTLFLWLDASRYGAYGPLYTAGKCVSFFSVMSWFVFFRRIIITAVLFNNLTMFMITGIVGILLFGDLLSVTAGIAVIKKTRMPVRTAGGE